MSEYNFDDKPKNDVVQEERGGCLTAFIAFVAIVNVAMIFLVFFTLSNLSQFPESQRGLLQMAFFIQIGFSIFAIACAYGLWNWKRWAYYGFFVIYGLNIVLSIISGQIPAAAGSVIGIAILYYLLKDKTHLLE
jgi:hypothetical protein